jgi:hypothetical protein
MASAENGQQRNLLLSAQHGLLHDETGSEALLELNRRRFDRAPIVQLNLNREKTCD